MLHVSDVPRHALTGLLHRFGLELVLQEQGDSIRGSFWGDSEAGIVGRTVYVRGDTPVHSLLHETSHVICMTEARRAGLDRDAGGDDLEEAAVCYLQVLLADQIEGVGSARLMADMDAWGYSFRLGNTLDWFQNDAEDATEFLMNHGLLSDEARVTFRLRD
jgi:hypothetical protein